VQFEQAAALSRNAREKAFLLDRAAGRDGRGAGKKSCVRPRTFVEITGLFRPESCENPVCGNK
jgi:hypothetical protein